MKKNIFIDEIKRRGKVDENAYSMIGTELKRVRTSQSQTLSSIAGDLCSVSYLCKIEKAQLKPNRYMLNEICKKLHLESPKLDLLFELKNLLLKLVKYYYARDFEEVKKLYETCKDLDNYRTKLIFLIYYITFYMLQEANEVSKELFKITSEMLDDELSIFLVFYSILKYYDECYNETIDNLKQLSSIYYLDDTLGKIASVLCLEYYVKINSPMTLLHSQKLLDLFLKSSEFSKAEYVRYLQTLYMIHNSMLESAVVELEFIKDKEFKNTLEFYYDIKNQTLQNKEHYKNLRPFARLIYIHLFEPKKYIEAFFNQNKNDFYMCDFSYNIANYFTFSDDKERYKELTDVIIPNILQTKDYIDKLFFLREFCRISKKYGRYKCFCNAYSDLEGEIL